MENNLQHFEEKISSIEIYKGSVFTVTKDTVTLENGTTAIREVVHHSGGAGVVVINDKDEVALVRQFRYGVGKEMLEIPAGKVEKGEYPMETAKREIEEEIGYSADSMQAYGSVAPTCAYCSEIIHIFLAKGLKKSVQKLDQDEFLTVEWIPFQTAIEMILVGEIIDSKTVSALLRIKIEKDYINKQV